MNDDIDNQLARGCGPPQLPIEATVALPLGGALNAGHHWVSRRAVVIRPREGRQGGVEVPAGLRYAGCEGAFLICL